MRRPPRPLPSALFCLLLVAGAGALPAKTPDGQTPSEETVCDGETGAAFGLCNAYCEAMDCDSPNHHAADQGCAQVKRNFERKTGRPLPCDVSCPCVDLLELFERIVAGTADVRRCLATDSLVSVFTTVGDVAVVSTDPPLCSANLEPPTVEITAGEVVACRDVLCRACAAQGVPCVHPE